MFSVIRVVIQCFLGIMLLEGAMPVHALIRRFELRSTSYTRLCKTKTILTINGQFPGPTIYATRGDLLTIDIINNADQNITIHWHGVKMPRYPWSDGADSITQCAIRPGKKFRQRMILSDEEGTLWWHAHSDWTRATVHGAIIILPPRTETYPFPKPHALVPIILGEWWNNDVQEVYETMVARGGDPQPSDAFLINGQPGDLYPCSAQDTYKLRVEFGKTYLIKLINAVMNNIMFFKIAGHNITIVGTDGAYTKPLRTDYISIPPGQTIDFLLEANQPPSHYYMAIEKHTSRPGGATELPTPATGIIEYVGNYLSPPSPTLPSFPAYDDKTAAVKFFYQLRSLANEVDVPKNVTKTLFLALSINLLPCTTCIKDEKLAASMNNVTMLLPTTDILDAYYRGIGGVFTTDFPDFPPSAFNYTQGVKSYDESDSQVGTAVSFLEYNSTVEMVFQATNYINGVEHPIHFHGYSFYVVGSGLGNFDPIRDPPNYNLVDPPLMETIVVPKNGWTTIRFRANNPGVWYLHCHFARHQSWGLKTVFIVKDGEAPNEKMLPPPPDMPHCQMPPQLLYRI